MGVRSMERRWYFVGSFFGFAVLAAGLFSAPLPAEAAFGISPPIMNADHLVKGAKYTQTVYLVQDRPDEDLPIRTRLDMPDRVKSWITIDTGMDFIIPKGTQQFPVRITVEVPRDIDLGAYSGRINFTSAPNQTGQVTIALGAEVIMNLMIGNDIYRKVTVPVIKVLDIEEGWDPKVFVKFENEGNVPENFTGATFELLDKFNAVRLAYIQKSNNFPEIPPFTTSEHTLDFPTNFSLGIGEYWANISFYQGEKLVASQKAVFNVLSAGSIAGWRGRAARFANQYGYFAGGAVALLLISGVLLSRRRPRRA